MKQARYIMAGLIFGAVAAVSGPAAQAMQPTTPAPERSTTDHSRYLSGELLRWQDDRLITSVGTYTLDITVQVDNRVPEVRSGFVAEKDKPAPKIQLKFVRGRLTQVVIY